MNTFWLKIAGIAVVVVVVIILVGVFLPSKSEPAPALEPKPQTIYEQWERDDQRLQAKPRFKEQPAPQQTTPTSNQTPPMQPPQPVEQPQPKFKKLSFEEEVEAQKLWAWVLNQRKMGRLPVMGYGQMVKTCREIIRRWPDSEYAFKAKRALADLPERYHKMYNITPEEIDLGNLK